MEKLYRDRKRISGFQYLEVREGLTVKMPRGISGNVGSVLYLECAVDYPASAFAKTCKLYTNEGGILLNANYTSIFKMNFYKVFIL